MRRIILWDIDHTLIENNGVSKEIYSGAFTALTGDSARHRARTEGRTDRLIMRDLFLDHQLEPPSWELIASALAESGAARLERLREHGTALPGAREALRTFARRSDVVQSVLTGNIRPNAWVKLTAFHLDHFVDLKVGAYGADAEDRTDLVAIARRRIANAYPDVPLDTSIVLIGDTPRDVEAAHNGGAHIIAVATGVHDSQTLAQAGAPVVLPNLCDSNLLLETLEQMAV
ncbi:haloacid dehalogenase-like hydrolase [Streptomyces sparsogenes]|uniref:haloacid dehalogenase-like hydrolase n=1 Tax=Streptomyces sparsogenes TaxID=67365 RepID=UPI0033F53ADC